MDAASQATAARGERVARLKDFFARNLRSYDLREDEDIFKLGFVSSLFALQLVEYVESEFSIEVADEDLDLANFRTLAAIASLVERKHAQSRAA
jgi:methoxymalonate biosynthesis acyl carrier protein